MGDYEITCIMHDANEVIIKVGVKVNSEVKVYDVETAVYWLEKGDHTLYTYKDKKKAKVYHKQHQISKRWFLTTNPDDTKENNLDFLPQCAAI